MTCRFPEIDRLMKLPETRPVTSYELDRLVEAGGRTRGVFVTDTSLAKKQHRRRARPEPPEDFRLRYDDDRDW